MGSFSDTPFEMINTSFTVPHNYVEFIERLQSTSPSFYSDNMDDELAS